jgi:magnesium transporter
MSLPVLAPGEVRVLMLWAACTPTTLITAEEEALPAIDRIVTERRNAAPSRLTLLDLFIEVLEAAASNAGPAYLSLRRKLDEFADAVENDPLKVPPDALLAMRRKVAQLSMLWEDQIHGFMEFQRCHSYVLPSDGSRDLLRDLVSDAGRSLKLLARMESRLLDLRQHQLHCLQDSTNRRLNMLAILSAIYLPATLIAGIYGMNFEHIPVTQLRYGYFVVLAIMLLVVLGQLWLFYRRGWFK